MNKHLLTFAILCALSLPASPASAQLAPQPCTFQVKQIKAPQQIVSTNMPGNFDIDLEVETDDCSIPLALERPFDEKPVLVWMKPKPGLLAHGEVELNQLQPGFNLTSETTTHALKAKITVMNMSKLTPGNQLVDMAMTYHAIDGSGNPVSGRFAFNVPFRVVAPTPKSFGEKTKTVLITTGLVAAAIPLVPLYILLSIFGVLPDC